jgi:hypothetical protein
MRWAADSRHDVLRPYMRAGARIVLVDDVARVRSCLHDAASSVDYDDARTAALLPGRVIR